MTHTVLRFGKKTLKRVLKACGLGSPLRALHARVIYTLEPTSLTSLGPQFDRTRVCVAVQAEMTRAAIAHETHLLQELVRMQAASVAELVAEQSERTRSLLFDVIHHYHLEHRTAPQSTDNHVKVSTVESDCLNEALRQKLQAPLTSAEIIGAFKVICAQLPPPEKVQELLDAHRRELLEPAAVLSEIVALVPGGNDRLNAGVQRTLDRHICLGRCENGAGRRTG
jgi:hypothetical protein